MSDSNYTKVFSGNFIVVQQIAHKLSEINITPIIKDESESGRLAGFGATPSGQQDVFVHNDELEKAKPIIEQIISTLIS